MRAPLFILSPSKPFAGEASRVSGPPGSSWSPVILLLVRVLRKDSGRERIEVFLASTARWDYPPHPSPCLWSLLAGPPAAMGFCLFIFILKCRFCSFHFPVLHNINNFEYLFTVSEIKFSFLFVAFITPHILVPFSLFGLIFQPILSPTSEPSLPPGCIFIP